MAIEIERKFLVNGSNWRENGTPTHFHQGYLSVGPPVSVRIRISETSAVLNIKQSTLEIQRDEFEYEIPLGEAEHMLEHLCAGHSVEKYRFVVEVDGFTWEIDEFLGENRGLIVAEIELESVDQEFTRPDWLGDEVSSDKRYFNSYLSMHPYNTW